MSSTEIKKKFESAFYPLVDELEKIAAETNISADAVKWFRENLIYNTIGGKYNRGISVIDSYRVLSGAKELTDAEYKKAAILGWCIELAFFLVADDIMDASKTRRGQPCWYLQPRVSMIAINDAFMLESAIYILLKRHFRQESYYLDLIELFHETTFQTEMGQLLDLITAPEDEVDLSKFSLQKHSFIVIYKTAFYSFYLPVVLAMYMAGVTDAKDLQQAKDVLLPLGEYFQVQDDYLDCYGDPSVIGKIGTDIQDNKCGWVINKALDKASPEQRKVLDENYGIKDAAAEERVKQVFVDLKIEQEYLDYEQTIVSKLKTQIADIDESRGFKAEVITNFLNKIYKRQK